MYPTDSPTATRLGLCNKQSMTTGIRPKELLAPWKSKVKVMIEVKVESHKTRVKSYLLTSLSYHVNRSSHSWDTAIWPWKSKVNVMGDVDIERHNMGPTFYRLTSLWFHVNRSSHSWDTTFSKFHLENPRSRSRVRGILKVTTWVQHSIGPYPFHSMAIGHPLPEIRPFQNLAHSLRILSILPTYKLAGLTKECQWCT